MAKVKDFFIDILEKIENAFDGSDDKTTEAFHRYFDGAGPSPFAGLLSATETVYVNDNKAVFAVAWDELIADRRAWSSDG